MVVFKVTITILCGKICTWIIHVHFCVYFRRYKLANDTERNKAIAEPRRVIKDENNSPVYPGPSDDRATISFRFDHKPEDIKDTVSKGFGLPEGYTVKKPEAKVESAVPKRSSPKVRMEAKAALDAAGSKVKEKIDERREIARAARDAAIERKRQQAHAHAVAARAAEQNKAAAADFDAINKAVEEKSAVSSARNSTKEAASRIDSSVRQFVNKQAEGVREQQANWEIEQKKIAKQDAERKKAAQKTAAASNTPKKKNEKKKYTKYKSKKYKTDRNGRIMLNKKGEPVKKRRWFLSAIKILLVLIIVGGIAGGSYVAYTISHAPKIHPDQIYSTLDVSSHIYNDKGKLIEDIYYEENREIAKYEDLPENLKNAFIAVEDKTFWTHKGFNFRRIFGAIWNSLTGGGDISGTSTITQQLARNVFLPEEKSVRSIKRKVIEMYYAGQIEDELSKEEILTAYMNTIYLGYGCYGVDTAAKYYFSSSLEDLSLAQCAALAALPQAPGLYSLIVTEPDEYCTDIGDGLYANDISAERRYLVLDLMVDQGYISAEDAEAAKLPVTEFIKPGSLSKGTNSAFKDYLIETVISDLMEQYDLTNDQATNMVYAKGLNIYSTLDSQAQKVITKEFKNKSSFPSSIKENSKVEAAMVITEVGTGEIKAMAGSRDASADKLFNRATSPRQPGSSIKPLAVYAPALQKSFEYQKNGDKFKFNKTGYDKQGTSGWGDYITASSTVTDEKMTVQGKTWPQNFSRSYSGWKNFRLALQQSINTCAVKILAQVGVEYSIETVKAFGITTLVDDTSQASNDVNLAALGLGAMTEGVTPLEMSLAYAAFPNGGVVNSGICYTKVTDSDGNVLLEGKSQETKVLDEGVAWIMTDILKTVVSRGIAGDAAISGEQVGGKTGTTDQTWDIWFDGFTPKYSAALWIGTDDNSELNTTSATAARLWSTIMSKVKRAKGGTYREQPSDVIYQDGEFYTKGTQPPIVVKEEKKDKSDKDKDKDSDKKEDTEDED